MKKLLSFLPAIFIMILIFGFSSQNGEQSEGLSAAVTQLIVRILHMKAETAAAIDLEFYVRKTAHFSEYLLLALSLAFALHVNGLRGGKQFTAIAIWCFLYACTDEFHQSFVGGRSPQVRDVLIDTCGGICGDLIGSALIGSFCHTP